MQTRRHFLQNMAFLAGAAGLQGSLLAAVQRAAAIEPEQGSSFLDAEHVVILMQENRSFDHAFGSLRGVRGFNDPRAIRLADGNPVFVQTSKEGDRHVPFELDMKQTKVTWMGSLPHGWTDQVDAANKGLHDRWLDVKKSSRKDYASIPLTLGYHTRKDIPFYYALADAFTICDQNFCSTLTGTIPNRLYLWTGTSRTAQTDDAQIIVRNEDCEYRKWVQWTTFPERLQDAGISWKIYQNELDLPTGLSSEEEGWLSNYGDNPIEHFLQFKSRFYPRHRQYLEKSNRALPGEIALLEEQLAGKSGEEAAALTKQLNKLKQRLADQLQDIKEFSQIAYDKLSEREKSLHARAFTTNSGDSHYRRLEELSYRDGAETRRLNVPRGDVLYQFRKDVEQGALPGVSWIVPSARFSDHPSNAWFGQWYLSEVLNILTSNPDVWKKTIFILTYDENDGYFDHIPPFQAPHPNRPETGRSSPGLSTAFEYLERDADFKYKPKSSLRDNSIGLGFRVPMIIASPWSRGGAVCSQVFDHTSVLRLLEKIASHRSGREVRETNITPWRRAICGDLTAAFRPSAEGSPGLNDFLVRDTYIEEIYNSRFKGLPAGYDPLTDAEVEQIRQVPQDSRLPRQEPDTRVACPLPYELAVNGALSESRSQFVIRFEARQERFGERAAGSPFIVYAVTSRGLKVRYYGVEPGSAVEDSWDLSDFQDGRYHLRVHGPNGYYREFRGNAGDPLGQVQFHEAVQRSSTPVAGLAQLQIKLDSPSNETPLILDVTDLSYGHPAQQWKSGEEKTGMISFDTRSSGGWYDIQVTSPQLPGFVKRYAGKLETGEWTTSDPLMAGKVSAASVGTDT
ncbi:phosphocholine-specific phospholipase C [Planctomicrobium sp. SH664]|uniref:phosphocholine-specific phospholipase C n=1 Tax=Planctomicrobium sp. SH664 TaxID=3448125 RepID=UPI003F5C31D9